MGTDTIEISKMPEEIEHETNNTEIVTKTRILRIFLLIFASIALMINNVIYISFVPLVLDEYSFTSDPLYFYFYGTMYASKDIALLIVSPLTGYLIDRVSFDGMLVGGFSFIILAAIISAFAESYWLFFTNRIFQGLASAFTDISIMCMISELFVTQRSRTNAFVMVFLLAGLTLLIASPFVIILSDYLLQNRINFLAFDVIVLVNGLILSCLTKRLRCVQMKARPAETTKQEIIPMWRLLIDPYVILCAGALMLSQTVVSFLIYFSPFSTGASFANSSSLNITCFVNILSYILGIGFAVLITKIYPRYQWLVVSGGIAMEGLCGLVAPFIDSYIPLLISTCGITFSVALIRIIVLPTLARLADAQQVSKYGSIYAIAYISYAIVDVIAPITLYNLIPDTALTAVFAGIAVLNILYSPLLYFLRSIY